MLNKNYINLSMDPEQARIKPRSCYLSDRDKEARIIALAEKLHVKIGQPRQKRRQS